MTHRAYSAVASHYSSKLKFGAKWLNSLPHNISGNNKKKILSQLVLKRMTQLQQVAFLCLLSPQRFHHFTLFLLFCFSDLGCLSSHPSSPPRLLSSCPPSSSCLPPSFFPPLSFILTPPSFSPSSYPDFSFPFSSFPPQPLHLFSSCLFPLFIFLHSFLSSQILLTQAVASFPISSFPALSLLSAFSLFQYCLPSFLFPLLPLFLSPFLPLPDLLFLPLFYIFFPSFIPVPHLSSAAPFPFCFFLCLSSFFLSSSLSSLLHLSSGFMSSHVSSIPSYYSEHFFLVASSLK